MNRQQIDEMTSALAGQLEERKPSGAIWRGHLSSSAISTSVAMFALYRTDSRKYGSEAAHHLESSPLVPQLHRPTIVPENPGYLPDKSHRRCS